MPIQARCDVCGNVARKNIATENGGVYANRGNLTVRITVVKSSGRDPIVCERCVRLAAYNGDAPATEQHVPQVAAVRAS